MGLLNILRVCSTLLLVAAISPASASYIFDNSTGTWKPTARTVLAPPGSASPFNYIPRDSPPSVSSTGAFQNKMGGSFGSPPVNGTSRNVPVTVNGTTTKPNVNKALLSRLGKGGLAGIALGVGIDALLDGIGALIDQAGNVSRPDMTMANAQGNSYCTSHLRSSFPIYSPNGSVHTIHDPTPAGPFQCASAGLIHSNNCSNSNLGYTSSYAYWPTECRTEAGQPPPPLVPFPPNELEDAINNGYQPHPSDYPFLAPDPAMAPTIVEVEPIPRLSIPPITTTTVDLDTGKTTIVETNVWQDFNIKDNNSDQPKIEADTTTKTDTYTDGVKTGESETTTSSGTATDSGAVAGSGQKLEIDIPTDCDFMPTVCEFLEWYKDDDLGEDPDLASIMKDDEEFAKTKVISFGAAVCPQPYTLHISALSMTAELSFEFFCQFAEYARALVLAAAYIFAAYISLGVARG